MGKRSWVTIARAAERTGIAKRTVYRWAYLNLVECRRPSCRAEGYILVKLEDVQRLAKERDARRSDR